jgi:uncharacterized protein YoxC
MAISLDENILLFIAGAVFIPVFIFFVKMIIELGSIKTKIDTLYSQMKGSEASVSKVVEQASDIRILKLRVDNLERDVDHLVKRTNPESSSGRERRDNVRTRDDRGNSNQKDYDGGYNSGRTE